MTGRISLLFRINNGSSALSIARFFDKLYFSILTALLMLFGCYENLFRHIILTGTIFVLGLSCSKKDSLDDEPIIEAREGTCFEGILNGDEVIIDCGGVCSGFCPSSSIGILVGER